MALKKANLNFPILGGMDTKSDFASVAPTSYGAGGIPNFDLVQDMQYNKIGAIEKRVGTTSSPDELGLTGIASFNKELLAFDGQRSYSRDFDRNSWVEKGTSQRVISSSIAISGDVEGNTERISTAVINNLALSSFRTTTSKFNIIDLNTGSVILTAPRGAEGNTDFTTVALGNFWYRIPRAYFLNSPYTRTSYLNPSETFLGTTLFPSGETLLDAIGANNRVYFLTRNAAGNPRIRYLSSDGTVSGAVAMPDTFISVLGCLLSLSNGEILISYNSAGNVTKTVRLSPDLTATVYTTVTSTLGANDVVKKLSLVKNPADAYELHICAQDTSDVAKSRFIYKVTFTVLHIATPPAKFSFGYQAVTNSFYFNEQYCFIAAVAYGGTTLISNPQYYNYYLVNNSGTTLGRVFFGFGFSTDSRAMTVLDGQIFTTFGARIYAYDKDTDNAGIQGTAPGFFNGILISQNVSKSSQVSAVANQLFLPSSISQVYDGGRFIEAGFFESPEIISTNSLAGTDAWQLRGATQYLYAVVYEIIGRDGRKIQSAPTFFSRTTAGINTQNRARIDFSVSPLIPTNETLVSVSVYRTALTPIAGVITSASIMSSTYHKLFQLNTSPPTLSAQNDKVQLMNFSDTISDVDVYAQEVLYTTGGVLANDTTPNCTISTSHRNRIFTNDASDPLRINFSKEAQTGEAIGFSENLYLNVDGEGGSITALKSLDDALIIFKERAMFALSGAGPLSTGAQNDYQTPTFLTTDVGCVNPDSVVTTPLGLVFKSSKGIYLLQRNLSVDYIGAAVEKYNDLEITGSILAEDVNEIRMYTAEGTTMVYNYYQKKWSVFSNQRALDAVNYNNKIVYLRTDGNIHTETPGVYTDNSSFYKPTLITGWMGFAGVQGYQRVYHFKLLGKSNGTHKLRVSIAYDYDETFNNSVIIDPQLVSTYYGQGNYGEGPYGGDGAYQWDIFPEYQKCQAIKIRIEEIETTPATAGFSLSNIAFTVGIKSSLGVTSDERSAGGS